MTIEGIISKQERPNGQGSYYQLTTEGGVDVAISMSESTKSVDDTKVLEPLIGKKVRAEGILRGTRIGQFLAFIIQPAE